MQLSAIWRKLRVIVFVVRFPTPSTAVTSTTIGIAPLCVLAIGPTRKAFGPVGVAVPERPPADQVTPVTATGGLGSVRVTVIVTCWTNPAHAAPPSLEKSVTLGVTDTNGPVASGGGVGLGIVGLGGAGTGGIGTPGRVVAGGAGVAGGGGGVAGGGVADGVADGVAGGGGVADGTTTGSTPGRTGVVGAPIVTAGVGVVDSGSSAAASASEQVISPTSVTIPPGRSSLVRIHAGDMSASGFRITDHSSPVSPITQTSSPGASSPSRAPVEAALLQS